MKTDTVDALIELIRADRTSEAAEMLRADPSLTMAHSGARYHGVSPLHWAAHRNATPLCKQLIGLGADINDSAGDWWLTPLAWGADAGSVDAVELLLQCGADVDQDAIVGTTALSAAAMGGSSQGSRDPRAYERIAELLIAHGASVDGRDERALSPLDDAIKYRNGWVAAILRMHGARESTWE